MAEIIDTKKPVSEAISLWDLIFKLRETLHYLLGRWVLLLIIGIIGAAIGFTYASTRKPEYVANLTFVLEESKESSLGSYAGVASQLGLNIGETSSSGVFSGDNIMEFLKSRLMVERALLADTIIGNKQCTLADLYIDIYGLKKRWENQPGLKDLSFPANSKAENLSRIQDSIILVLHSTITKSNLTVDKPDTKLGFIRISTTSLNECFSQLFTEKLVAAAIDFYVRTKTQRSRNNVDNLQKQADSLAGLLDKQTYNLAVNQDLNLNPAKKVAMISSEISDRNKMLLSTTYAEVVRNLGMAKMTLVQETPIIQIVDDPILPLKKLHASRLLYMIGGGFLFVLAASCFMIVKKAFKAALDERSVRNERINN